MPNLIYHAIVINMKGFFLRQIRKQKGITISEVAKKTGLSLSFLSYFENNQRNARDETIKSIGKALGLTEEELEEIKIDAKIEEIGMNQPEFTMMFKEIAIGEMTINEKRKILDVYDLIKHQRQKQNDQFKEGGQKSYN